MRLSSLTTVAILFILINVEETYAQAKSNCESLKKISVEIRHPNNPGIVEVIIPSDIKARIERLTFDLYGPNRHENRMNLDFSKANTMDSLKKGKYYFICLESSSGCTEYWSFEIN